MACLHTRPHFVCTTEYTDQRHLSNSSSDWHVVCRYAQIDKLAHADWRRCVCSSSINKLGRKGGVMIGIIRKYLKKRSRKNGNRGKSDRESRSLLLHPNNEKKK